MIKIKVGNKKYSTYYNPERQEWINSLPIEWTQKRIAFNTKLLTGFAFKSEQFSFDEGIQLVRGDNVTEGSLRWGNKERLWPLMGPEYENFLLEENDILIGMDGSKVGKNFTMIKKEDLPLLLVQRVARLRTDEELNPEFLYYCIGNKLFLYWITINKTDPMVPHITPKDITNYEIAFPSLSEQILIAQFLDQKTYQIDKLIEQKEKLLKLLTEKRTAIITQAVTKGLDSTVEMKDSGVDLLGEIPKEWEVKKIKYLSSKVGDGLHGTPEYTDETEFHFINGNNLGNGVIQITPQTRTISEEQFLANEKGLTPQTILLSINGTIGNIAFYQGEKVMLGKSAAYIIFFEWIDIKFIRWFMESSTCKNYFDLELTGTTIKNLSLESIKNTPMTFPNKSIQKEIVNYLDIRVESLDNTKSFVEKSILKLKEYREALITSAVTGQIDIRKEVNYE